MNGAWEKLADGNENGQQDYGADKTRLTTFTYPSLADKRTLNMVNAKFLVSVRGLYESDESVIRRPLLKS